MPKLPIVTRDVGFAVKAEMEQTPANEYVARILERLETENPCVAEFISHFSLQHEDPVAVSTSALLVYRLLESQMESDEMKDNFGQ